MPFVDLLVLAAFAIGAPAFGLLYWRRGVRGLRLLAVWWTSFVGFVFVVMMLAHSIDIAQNAIRGNMPVRGEAWTYDWRFYSLQLFGAVLIWFGGKLLVAAARLSHGEAAARREILRSAFIVLVIVAPLIPIHGFFAYPLTGLATLTLVVVGFAARDRMPVAVTA